jgi:uncharacterized protein YecE (DUF72 family)
MELLVGTSGYAYKEWRGSFYPDGMSEREMLDFYGRALPAVEINNTFYRLPRGDVLERWAQQVPESFRFALKASRRITHFGRLKGVEDETAYLLRAAAHLGGRLGALLFQLPPNLALDLARLDDFLALLPPATPAAFEFRHPSWRCDAVYERLRAQGAALVGAEDDDAPAEPLVATADWGYLRLRRSDYAREDLARWVQQLRACAWQRAFVFFKHEDAGAGPRLAAAFLELAQRAERRSPAAARAPAAAAARERA